VAICQSQITSRAPRPRASSGLSTLRASVSSDRSRLEASTVGWPTSAKQRFSNRPASLYPSLP
jgi:hypothetical protein